MVAYNQETRYWRYDIYMCVFYCDINRGKYQNGVLLRIYTVKFTCHMHIIPHIIDKGKRDWKRKQGVCLIYKTIRVTPPNAEKHFYMFESPLFCRPFFLSPQTSFPFPSSINSGYHVEMPNPILNCWEVHNVSFTLLRCFRSVPLIHTMYSVAKTA